MRLIDADYFIAEMEKLYRDAGWEDGEVHFSLNDLRGNIDSEKTYTKELPSAQPQYTELTPEEAASEIASGSTMSAYYWLDDMMRLKQMGYVICRKNDESCVISRQAVVMCKDCIHKPIINDPRAIGGFGLRFPDNSKCPCQCDDGYYSWKPNDNWFCANGEKEEKNK